MTAPTVIGTDRLELGEGIRWMDGQAVLTDILTGRLLSAPGDPAAPHALITQLPCPLGAVAPVEGRPGHWIAAAGTGICRIDDAGGVDWIARPEDGARTPMRMNDGVADPHGRFWAGSMAYDATEDAGSLYRVDRDGRVTRVLRGITVPNGPAFTSDGTVMYLADSARRLIRRYPVDPATGELGEPEPHITLGAGSPDGMTTDIEGGLWTAVWGTGQVRRYHPDGSLDRIVDLPAAQPAGLCLGGPDGRTLLVTSARIGLPDPHSLDGAVFAFRVDVPGIPAAPYRPVHTAHPETADSADRP
ncbi:MULTISPECIES: SMP-30/gluconolactonase/LRE family protein [Streptomyces]|uniref:SMP-30/gluconolactonase/LRE family protein n=1 Tax=Streptomyces dengpaensis TaxID=2049881 RepID=A0ABN5IEB8_9ACTN|nr:MULTISPECIES: SMP-30/gluconolactonase/LRE family protein [Streptomyces]AVH60630.1 SMP-30/gluconolactonase/LRE family protein [Streptomyces dengpaensis]PIB02759.1 gluconolaconase [Streptomyces sp. HG99]